MTLGPFAVLLGLNAAGKSNFMDALRFVRDALVDGLESAVTARGGLNALLRRVPETTDEATIALELCLPGATEQAGPWQARCETTISRPPAAGPAAVSVWSRREACEVGLTAGQPDARLIVRRVGEPSDSSARWRLRPGSLYLPVAGVREPYAPCTRH